MPANFFCICLLLPNAPNRQSLLAELEFLPPQNSSSIGFHLASFRLARCCWNESALSLVNSLKFGFPHSWFEVVFFRFFGLVWILWVFDDLVCFFRKHGVEWKTVTKIEKSVWSLKAKNWVQETMWNFWICNPFLAPLYIF